MPEVSKRLVKVGEYVYHTTKNTLPRFNVEELAKPRLARRAVTHVYDAKGNKVGHFTTTRDLFGEGKKTSQIHFASHLRPGSGIGEEALRQSMRSLKTDQFAHSAARTSHGDAFTRRTSKPETLRSPRPTGDESNLKRATGKEEKVPLRAGMRARAFSYLDSDADYLMSRNAHPFGRKSMPTVQNSRAHRHAVAGVPVVGGSLVLWNKQDHPRGGKGKFVSKSAWGVVHKLDQADVHVVTTMTGPKKARLRKLKRKIVET